MTGLDKAAILLLSIGEATAAKVMQQLDEQTVNNLSLAMSRIKSMDQGRIQNVLDEFTSRIGDQTSHSVESFDYVRHVLDEAIGEREAARVMEYIMQGGSMATTMEIMRAADPATLAEQMRSERPQAIALMLAHLDTAAGSELLSRLPEEVSHDVLHRYARLDSIQPQVLTELSEMLSEQLSGQVGTQQLSGVGGPRKAADLLNNLQTSSAERLLNEIGKFDQETAESIRESMFTFSDLFQLDSRALQRLMREITTDDLVTALKAAPPEVVDKVLSNVSSRAAESIREDLDNGPPVRRSEAEMAQKEIVRTARRLDSEGEITISADEDLL